jgi:hypothetical protein
VIFSLSITDTIVRCDTMQPIYGRPLGKSSCRKRAIHRIVRSWNSVVLNPAIHLAVASSRVMILLSLTSAHAGDTKERWPINKFEPSSSIALFSVKRGVFGVVALFHADIRRHRLQLPRLSRRKCVECPQRGVNASAHPRAVRHRVVQTDQSWTVVSQRLGKRQITNVSTLR